MNWLKKLLGRGDEARQSEAMQAASSPAGDEMHDEEERARTREQMEQEIAEAKQREDQRIG